MPKPASAVVIATDTTTARPRLAASTREDPVRASTNEARRPRLLATPLARSWARSARPSLHMSPTLHNELGLVWCGGQGLLRRRTIVADHQRHYSRSITGSALS